MELNNCKNVYDAGVYESVTRTVESMLKFASTHEERLAIYDWSIMVLREGCRAATFEIGILGIEGDALEMCNGFPETYLKGREEVRVQPQTYRGAPIPVRNTCLISSASDKDKIPSAFLDVKNNGFRQDFANYQIIYYPEANMCIACNGFHHTSMASLFQEGNIIPTGEVSLTEMFPYVKTDGYYWIDIKTGGRLSKTFDSRIATIYELLRHKHLLESDIQ